MMKPTPAALWAALSFPVLFAQDIPLNLANRASPDAAIAINIWTLGAPMPTPREGVFTGAVGNRIYVTGGERGSAVLNVNEVYDTVADSWSSAAAMPAGRWNGASAVVNNILYTIGGQSNAAPVTTNVEAYDPLADRWSMNGRREIIRIPVFVGDVFDEQHEQDVVLVLARVHAAAQLVARGPERRVEFGFLDRH